MKFTLFLYKLHYIGDSNSYGRKGILSGPIFMDSVACYGSEDKLINCTYNTDTTAGGRLNQIWIQCDIKSESTSSNEKKSTSTTSVAALALSLIALGISVLVMVFLIGYILYRYKSKPCVNERLVKPRRTTYLLQFFFLLAVFAIREKSVEVPKTRKMFKNR